MRGIKILPPRTKIIPTLVILVIILASLFSTGPGANGGDLPPVNAGYPINTEGDDFCPSITEDGRLMVFSSRMPGQKHHDIYTSRFEGGQWTTPVPLAAVNSGANDETPYITPDGSLILFSSDRDGSVRPSVTADGRSRITFDLFQSRFINGRWTTAEPLPGDVNTIFNERSPSLSPDKKTLYFSRWPFRRIRDSRIYRAHAMGDGYFAEEELPPVINSGNSELAFMPSRKLEGYYFSSRREGGLGGWDIYFVPSDGQRFGTPVNLGPAVNGPGDELFPAESDGLLYFCSNRGGGLGRYDIFYRAIPTAAKESAEAGLPADEGQAGKGSGDDRYPSPETPASSGRESIYGDNIPEAAPAPAERSGRETEVVIRVLLPPGEAPGAIRAQLYLKDTPDPRKSEKRMVEETPDEMGFIRINPRSDIRWIVVKINENGYLPVRKSIRVRHGMSQTVIIPVVRKKGAAKSPAPAPAPVKKATSGNRLKTIHFPFNSAVIPLKYYPRLHSILDYMRDNPSVRLEIKGHSDPWGPEKASDRISLQRAQAVRDYLERMGIRSDRMTVNGNGSRNPLRTVSGRRNNWINRRVEFRVMAESRPAETPPVETPPAEEPEDIP